MRRAAVLAVLSVLGLSISLGPVAHAREADADWMGATVGQAVDDCMSGVSDVAGLAAKAQADGWPPFEIRRTRIGTAGASVRQLQPGDKKSPGVLLGGNTVSTGHVNWLICTVAVGRGGASVLEGKIASACQGKVEVGGCWLRRDKGGLRVLDAIADLLDPVEVMIDKLPVGEQILIIHTRAEAPGGYDIQIIEKMN